MGIPHLGLLWWAPFPSKDKFHFTRLLPSGYDNTGTFSTTLAQIYVTQSPSIYHK